MLEEIGAESIPRLEVMNKIDLLELAPRIDLDDQGQPQRVWLSARDGSGIDLLQQAISARLGGDMVHCTLALQPGQGRLRASFYRQGAVVTEQHDGTGLTRLEIRMPRSDFRRLVSAERINPDTLLGQSLH